MTWVRNLPAEQRETAQIRKVYELLVKPNPAYGNCREDKTWAWAQKLEA